MRQYKRSILLDLTQFDGKNFKIISALIRSVIILEHGYPAIKGITDKRLSLWPIAIRFSTAKKRKNFINSLKCNLSINARALLNYKLLKPRSGNHYFQATKLQKRQ